MYYIWVVRWSILHRALPPTVLGEGCITKYERTYLANRVFCINQSALSGDWLPMGHFTWSDEIIDTDGRDVR